MRTGHGQHTVESFSMLRLRKAALLAHWMPGLGVRVHQNGQRIVCAATFPAHPSQPPFAIELDPCQFRRLVLALGDERGEGLHPIDLERSVEIEYFSDTGTRLGPHGLVRSTIDAATSVFGFACAIDLATAELVGLERGGTLDDDGLEPLPVHFDHDPELGVTLVHRAFESDCPRQERRVLDVLLDLASVFGAEEVVSQFDISH